jgi:transposase-like protein
MNEKSPMQKSTVKDFQKRFPDNDTCLEWLRRKLYPEKIFCTTCRKPTKHYKIRGRKVYTCEECSHHFSPTAGTIFHKSPTPLTTWFYTIYLMAQTRGGISAKQIQRETGVTYKTAWRMCTEIRKRVGDKGIASFAVQIEVDKSYFGGKNKGGKRKRGSENKTPFVGLVQRKGQIKAFVVSDTKSSTVLPIINKIVEKGSQVYAFEYPVYDRLTHKGY